jgi:UDP-N-acetylglucosamine--N-acetylmuramyl-(pentapeptide) pyrophosphoryl-undecaprenol N-acetylglucosamine transferase
VVTVLIAGGGTGGHVFPMVAVGDAVRAAQPDARVVYVGTARGIEQRVMGERGDDLRLLDIEPLRGGGARQLARGAWAAARSMFAARALVKELAPSCVLSVGGYAGGPVSLAAKSLGVPVTLLEPNSVVGLSNKLLAPFVARAYTAFPEVEKAFAKRVVVRAGVPLRRSFEPAPHARRSGALAVLVLGGSLGAKALNEVVPRAIADAVAARVDLRVVHQTGKDRDVETRARYAELGLGDRAEVAPFIDDVPAALAAADVVIARSGASSCAELCAIGRASVLVPFPFAVDDHQYKNARSLEAAGAAIVIRQSDATPARVAAELAKFGADPALAERMGERARARGNPRAAALIAEDLLALARGEGEAS